MGAGCRDVNLGTSRLVGHPLAGELFLDAGLLVGAHGSELLQGRGGAVVRDRAWEVQLAHHAGIRGFDDLALH